MAKFQYNWATAEIIKLYLRNSRAQEKKKARTAADTASTSQDAPAVDTGLTAAATNVGGSHMGDTDSDDSDIDD